MAKELILSEAIQIRTDIKLFVPSKNEVWRGSIEFVLDKGKTIRFAGQKCNSEGVATGTYWKQNFKLTDVKFYRNTVKHFSV